MFSHQVATVCNASDAEKFVKSVHGKTYMNFQVTVAPFNGMYVVNVTSSYDAPDQEIMDMLVYLMFTELCRLCY